MLRKNTSLTLMSLSLAIVFSLCSPNAFSGGTKHIEFLQKIAVDKETYTVTAKWSTWRKCVDSVQPWFVETVPGVDNGQIVDIHYLSTIHECSVLPSSQLFEVQSKQHPERIALLSWTKLPGRDPVVEIKHDPKGILSVEKSKDGDTIKVWISYSTT